MIPGPYNATRDERPTARRGGTVSSDLDRDLDIMTRLGRGEEAALEQLFERHGPSVFGLARKIVSDQQLAEEVL